MVQASAQSWLANYAAEVRPQIDRALSDATDFHRGETPQAAAARSANCPPRLQEAMRYSLLAPGKRLRPMLAMLAAEACGRSGEVALPAACAVEMVHAYSLIHDDLPAMDDDDLRRGRPTCHKVYGEALAILAGDALLALAFDVLASADYPAWPSPHEPRARCCAALAAAAGPAALVGGQVDDLDAERHGLDGASGDPSASGGWMSGQATGAHVGDDVGDDRRSLERLRSIHARKTAAMLIASLKLGGICAAATPPQLAALEEYGYHLGLAFQIMDDLLDVKGTETNLGKRVGKDSQRGKLTYPGLVGVEQSYAYARRDIEQARAALAGLAPHADGLDALALFVVERDR